MKGLFTIFLHDKNNQYDEIIRSYITSIKYYNVRTIIEPNMIKIYCNDYRASQHLVCTITDEKIFINNKFTGLNGIFRQMKIEELNGE